MKKILSVLLMVAMLIGCVSPAIVASAAGDVVEVSVEDAEVAFNGSDTLAAALTLAGTPAELVELHVIYFWSASVEVSDIDFAASALVTSETGFGKIYAGTNRAVKSTLTGLGLNAADYSATILDVYAEDVLVDGDVLGEAQFIFDGTVAAGTEFTYGVAVTEAYDVDDGEPDLCEDVHEATITVAADAVLEALKAEFEGQTTTFKVEDVVVDADAETAEVRIFVLNNDENDPNASAKGLWGTKLYLYYPNDLTLVADANGYVYEDAAKTMSVTDADTTANKPSTELLATSDGARKAFTECGIEWGTRDDVTLDCKTYQIYYQPDDSEAEVFGNGTLITLTFALPENYVAGQTWEVGVCCTSVGDVCDATPAAIAPVLANGSVKVEGEFVCTHENTKDVVTKEATCTETGLKNVVCADCDAVLEEDVVIEMIAHTEETIPSVTVGCETDGATAGVKCSVCGTILVEPEVITAEGHVWGEGVVTKEATTTEEGELTYTCTKCSETKTEVIPMVTTVEITVATTPDSATVPVTVTYNTGIWALRAQMVIGDLEIAEIQSGLFTVTADNYSVADGVLTIFVDADTMENITEDGTLFTIVFAKNGTAELELEVLDLINADGADVVYEVVNGALVCEHDFVADVVDATIYEDGLCTMICSKCGEIGETTVLPKLAGLFIESVEAVPGDEFTVDATLSANPGVWSIGATFTYDVTAMELVSITSDVLTVECSDVDGVVTVFADANEMANVEGDVVVLTLTFTALAAEPGDYDVTAEIIAANTINVDGELVGIGVDNGVVTILDCKHPTTEVVGATEATCTEAGYTGDTVCTICGVVLEEGEAIEALGHTPGDVVDAVDATCSAEGYTGDVYCTVCAELLEQGTAIEKLAHTPGDVVGAAEATCTEDGYTGDVYCTVCNELLEEGEVIEALGHTPGDVVNAAEATCTENGYTGDVYCTVCNELLEEGEAIEALGHTPGDPVDAVDATCLNDGYTGDVYCTVCGELLEEGEAIEKLAHTPGERAYAVEATCTEDGYTGDISCAVCDTLLELGETIPATGHTPGDPVGAKEATTEEEGYTGDIYCTVCGELLEKGEVIEKLPPEEEDLNGLVWEDGVLYYYVDNVRTKAGLIKIGGDYYYVRSGGIVVTGESYYCSYHMVDMPKGTYEFDADGKMIIDKDDSEGDLVWEDGVLYYYLNNVRTKVGLLKYNGDYYYVKSGGIVAVNETYYCSYHMTDIPKGTYEFDANGKMIID